MLNGCLVVVSNKKNVRASANTTWKKKSVSGFFNKKIFSYHYFSPEFPPSPWHFIIWPSYMAVVGGAARIDTEKAARSWPVRQWRWPWAAKRRPPMRQMGGQVLAKAWPPFHRLGRPSTSMGGQAAHATSMGSQFLASHPATIPYPWKSTVDFSTNILFLFKNFCLPDILLAALVEK